MNDLKQEDLLKQILLTMDDTDNKLISVVTYMQKVLSVLIFMVVILLLRVFLWDTINNYMETISNFWSGLSEGYRMLFLGLIGSVPAGAAANVIGHVINEKIKNASKK